MVSLQNRKRTPKTIHQQILCNKHNVPYKAEYPPAERMGYQHLNAQTKLHTIVD